MIPTNCAKSVFLQYWSPIILLIISLMHGGRMSIELHCEYFVEFYYKQLNAKNWLHKEHYMITNESGIMLSLGYLWHDVSHGRTYDPLIKWLCLFEAVTIEQRCIINVHFKANILNNYVWAKYSWPHWMCLLDAKKNFCTVLQPNLSTYSFFVQTDYISFMKTREKSILLFRW